MAKVQDMLNPGRPLADAIRRLLGENLDDIDKSLNVASFDRHVDQLELLECWQHLSSSERALYKRLLALGNEHANF